jgi:sugar phosphate isomerase/epimerase
LFALSAIADEASGPGFPHPFFAFDNGTGRGVLSPADQAEMLHELGYAGIGYTGTKGIPEMLAALDKHDLKMFSIYVGAVIGPEGPTYDSGIPAAIEQLKGRGTIIWLTVRGRADNGEEQAVQVVREIGDLAAKANLRVALYPHVGFYVARVEDAVRIVERVDRPNVGASFNLCHWLQVGDEPNMKQRVEQSLPHLFLVSINGADHEGGWDRLIQTLDRGEFDVYAFVKTLDQLGYKGPIGLQCYSVKGDRRENLRRSVGAWRAFCQRRAKE